MGRGTGRKRKVEKTREERSPCPGKIGGSERSPVRCSWPLPLVRLFRGVVEPSPGSSVAVPGVRKVRARQGDENDIAPTSIEWLFLSTTSRLIPTEPKSQQESTRGCSDVANILILLPKNTAAPYIRLIRTTRLLLVAQSNNWTSSSFIATRLLLW